MLQKLCTILKDKIFHYKLPLDSALDLKIITFIKNISLKTKRYSSKSQMWELFRYQTVLLLTDEKAINKGETVLKVRQKKNRKIIFR